MTNAELDMLYDTADLLMKKGNWGLIDDILEYYANSAWRQDINLLLGWATVTHCARNKLKNRPRFMEACQNFHKDPELWKGLRTEDPGMEEFWKAIGVTK